MVSSSSRNHCRVFLVSPEHAKQGLAASLEVCSVNSSANQFPLPRLCLCRSPHLDVLPRVSAGSGPLSLHCLSLQGSPWAFPECTCASFPMSLAPNEVHIPRCPGLASFRPSSKCQPVLHRKCSTSAELNVDSAPFGSAPMSGGPAPLMQIPVSLLYGARERAETLVQSGLGSPPLLPLMS